MYQTRSRLKDVPRGSDPQSAKQEGSERATEPLAASAALFVGQVVAKGDTGSGAQDFFKLEKLFARKQAEVLVLAYLWITFIRVVVRAV